MSIKLKNMVKSALIVVTIMFSAAQGVSAKDFEIKRYYTVDLQNVCGKSSNVLIETLFKDMDIQFMDYDLLQDRFPNNKNSNDDVHTNGFFNLKEKIIRINEELSGGEQDRVLYHELGHYIDALTDLSQTEEFKQIFEEERYTSSYLSGEYYFTEKIKEYWAESFSIVANKPQKARKDMPKTYDYITEKVNEFNDGFNTALTGKVISAAEETSIFIDGFQYGYINKNGK